MVGPAKPQSVLQQHTAQKQATPQHTAQTQAASQHQTMLEKFEKNLSPQQKAAVDKAVKEAEAGLKKILEQVFGKKTVEEQLKDPHSLLTKLLNAARRMAAIKQETSFMAAIIMAVIKHFEQIIKHLSSAEKWNKAGHFSGLDAELEEAAERQQVIRIQKAALADAQERQQHFNEITKELNQALHAKEELTENYLKDIEPLATQNKLLEEKLGTIEVDLKLLQEAREALQEEKATTYDALEAKQQIVEAEYQNAEQQFQQTQAAKTEAMVKEASQDVADLMPGTTATDRNALLNRMLPVRNPKDQKEMLKQYCQEKGITYSEVLGNRVLEKLKNIHAEQKVAQKEFALQPAAKAKAELEDDASLFGVNYMMKAEEQESKSTDLNNAKTNTQAKQAEVSAGLAAVDQKYKPLFDAHDQQIASLKAAQTEVMQSAEAILEVTADKKAKQNQNVQQSQGNTATNEAAANKDTVPKPSFMDPFKTTPKPPGTPA